MRNLAVVVASILFLAPAARADLVLAVDFTGNPTAGSATGTFGYSFTVGNNPLMVDAMALEAVAFPDSQTVRLWQDGTTTNVISTTILATDPLSTTAHSYRYHAITPVTLQANTTYDIAYDDPGVGHFFADQVMGVSNNPDITFGTARSANTTGAFPANDFFAAGPYFGPSFEVVVPEPTSFLLVGMGAVGMTLGAWRWTKKKEAPERLSTHSGEPGADAS